MCICKNLAMSEGGAGDSAKSRVESPGKHSCGGAEEWRDPIGPMNGANPDSVCRRGNEARCLASGTSSTAVATKARKDVNLAMAASKGAKVVLGRSVRFVRRLNACNRGASDERARRVACKKGSLFISSSAKYSSFTDMSSRRGHLPSEVAWRRRGDGKNLSPG